MVSRNVGQHLADYRVVCDPCLDERRGQCPLLKPALRDMAVRRTSTRRVTPAARMLEMTSGRLRPS